MDRVRVEFLMWLGKELGPEWVSPGDARANLETEVAPGTTVRQLMKQLAQRYPAVREKLLREEELAPYIIGMINQKGVDRAQLMDQVLSDGDVLTVLPIFVGG